MKCSKRSGGARPSTMLVAVLESSDGGNSLRNVKGELWSIGGSELDRRQDRARLVLCPHEFNEMVFRLA